jgi:hypothetical protein
MSIDSDVIAQARDNLHKRRAFTTQLAFAVVVNVFLVAVWALSGAGYFWPGWVMAATVFSLGVQGWNAYGRKPITDADVDAEVKRLQG